MSGALAAYHDAFIRAVFGEETPLAAFSACEGLGVRVYRNNVLSAIESALASNYPAVRRLVGEAFFLSAAQTYFQAAPPRVRTLTAYGDAFPEFLDALPEAQSTPYLGAVARLDRAWLEAHLAPEAAALAPGDLAVMDEQILAQAKIALHPSARIITLGWRVYEIWRANRAYDASVTQPREAAPEHETALLWRCVGEVQSRSLRAAEAAFLRALAHGSTLGGAGEAALRAAPEANVSEIVAGALSSGALACISNEEGAQ